MSPKAVIMPNITPDLTPLQDVLAKGLFVPGGLFEDARFNDCKLPSLPASAVMGPPFGPQDQGPSSSGSAAPPPPTVEVVTGEI